jgi:ATP-binding cassette, subfamily B, bacterial
VLNRINLRFEPGEVVAIVGENGAGKSTLIKLLCRLYDPTVGVIRLDGVDLRDFDRISLYDRYALVFQDFNSYMASVRENIALSDTTAMNDFARIVSSARKSGADEFIRALPNGYETPLQHGNEDGVDLSGGQWQMLALARAMIRDASIIILDEPTSALSPTAKHAIFEMLQTHLSRSQIGIYVSHRFSTIRRAHRIVVIENGQIIESGKHDDLVARNGTYARMYALQANAFAASPQATS